MITDDILRFADKQKLDKFTVLGHSLGGRSAMTFAGRFPDRVDSCISVDAAPVNEEGNKDYGEFTYKVVSLEAFTNLLVVDFNERHQLITHKQKRGAEAS